MTSKFKIGDAILIATRPQEGKYEFADAYIGMVGKLERVNGKDKSNRRHFWTDIPLLPEHSHFINPDSRGMKSVCTSDIILLSDCAPCQIAQAIRTDWKTGISFAAMPYVTALWCMTDWNSDYGSDSARSVIRYFLSNATTWKGRTARLIKKCLNDKIR